VPKYTTGRELAVLKGGPYAYCWYWRDELEAQQKTAREAVEMGRPAAAGAKAYYAPTEEWAKNTDPNPKLNGVLGRVWEWKPPAIPAQRRRERA
jgi:hypothetical protein